MSAWVTDPRDDTIYSELTGASLRWEWEQSFTYISTSVNGSQHAPWEIPYCDAWGRSFASLRRRALSLAGMLAGALAIDPIQGPLYAYKHTPNQRTSVLVRLDLFAKGVQCSHSGQCRGHCSSTGTLQAVQCSCTGTGYPVQLYKLRS